MYMRYEVSVISYVASIPYQKKNNNNKTAAI